MPPVPNNLERNSLTAVRRCQRHLPSSATLPSADVRAAAENSTDAVAGVGASVTTKCSVRVETVSAVRGANDTVADTDSGCDLLAGALGACQDHYREAQRPRPDSYAPTPHRASCMAADTSRAGRPYLYLERQRGGCAATL